MGVFLCYTLSSARQVAKGPDSAGAVRLARELGGVTVRGNHEFEVRSYLVLGLRIRSELSVFPQTQNASL